MNFHTSQCYFISALEIAALMLARQSKIRVQGYSIKIFIYDSFWIVPVAMNGIVPIMFTLTCLKFYARLTWYTVVLSWITAILSSTGLFFALDSMSWQNSDIGRENDSDTDIEGYIVFARRLCGSRGHLIGTMRPDSINRTLVVAICVLCLTVGLHYTIMHAIETLQPEFVKRLVRKRDRFKRSHLGSRWASTPNERSITISSCILWTASFAYLFYLYSLFSQRDLISSTWSLGQVVAVLAWVPSIVEFLITENGEMLPFSSIWPFFKRC